MMLLSSLTHWLVSLLCSVGRVSLEVEEDWSLIQDRLASQEKFLALPILKEVSNISKSTEEDFERTAPALSSSFGLQFPSMSQCIWPQIIVTLNRLERRLKQPRHFLMILELFTRLGNTYLECHTEELSAQTVS